MNEIYEKLRYEMVETQIRRRGIKDNLVLKAMEKVPRHLFVPPSSKESAYRDYPLPIGMGQTISQPYIVAFMTEALELNSRTKVLEIGTGCGYQTAVLAEIAHSVYTVEIIADLLEKAEKLFDKLGYKNIITKCADGYYGWKENSPFDAIIVAAAPRSIPKPLIEQLRIGGRMIIPVGDMWQNLIMIRKNEDGLTKEKVLSVRFVSMTGEAEKGKLY